MEPSVGALTESKLKLFKNYPTEILFFCMAGMIAYQNVRQTTLETKVDAMTVKLENYMTKDQQVMIKAIAESTQAVKDNTKVMTDVSDYLRIKETREALKN